DLPEREVSLAEAVVEFGNAVVARDGIAHELEGGTRLPAMQRDQRQELKCLRLRRLERQDLAVLALGFGDPAGAVIGDRLVHLLCHARHGLRPGFSCGNRLPSFPAKAGARASAPRPALGSPSSRVFAGPQGCGDYLIEVHAKRKPASLAAGGSVVTVRCLELEHRLDFETVEVADVLTRAARCPDHA